jgi:hypothetical protein
LLFCIVVDENDTMLGWLRPDAEAATVDEAMEPGPS